MKLGIVPHMFAIASHDLNVGRLKYWRQKSLWTLILAPCELQCWGVLNSSLGRNYRKWLPIRASTLFVKYCWQSGKLVDRNCFKTIWVQNTLILRTECKAVPRRVPRQDCQQVPTLQVGKQPLYRTSKHVLEIFKTDFLQCTNVGKEQCQTIPRQACKSVPKYETPFLLFLSYSNGASMQVCSQVWNPFPIPAVLFFLINGPSMQVCSQV